MDICTVLSHFPYILGLLCTIGTMPLLFDKQRRWIFATAVAYLGCLLMLIVVPIRPPFPDWFPATLLGDIEDSGRWVAAWTCLVCLLNRCNSEIFSWFTLAAVLTVSMLESCISVHSLFFGVLTGALLYAKAAVILWIIAIQRRDKDDQ